MIAKHVALRSLKKSDFAALVQYLTDPQGKTERLGPVTVSHCQAATLEAAIAEVLATQRLNTRAAGDKTYHLLVSFRAGERPDDDTLQVIEARICEGLGFAEHQRISVVHHDTDNLHVHIAVNTIHPTRHTLHEPYQAYRTLAELCTVLERDFGLERVNHQARRRTAEGRAADLEHHAGIESLVGWIQRECLDAIRDAPSWAALHPILRENGLELRSRANGFIFEAADGTRVKASTVARDLSKPKLEARLGPFEPSPEQPTEPRRQYQKPPLRLRVNTVQLYARYQAERQDAETSRTIAWRQGRQRKQRRLEAAKRSNRLRRATIKLMGGGRLMKKLLYAQAHQALRQDIEAIHRQYRKARQAITARFPRRSWADWLKQKALEGDTEALAALRARAAQALKGNTIQGEGELRPVPALPVDTITKQGTIIYRAGQSAVRDDGTKLQVAREASPEDLQAALRLAIARYGERLTVNGTTEFKQQIVQAAAAAHLPLTFAAAALERRRQALLMKESNPEQPERPPHRGGALAERSPSSISRCPRAPYRTRRRGSRWAFPHRQAQRWPPWTSPAARKPAPFANAVPTRCGSHHPRR